MMTEEEEAACLAMLPTKEESDAHWAEYERLQAIENKKLVDIKERVKKLCGSGFHAVFCQYIDTFKTFGDMWSWEITTKKPHVRRAQEIDELPKNPHLTHEYVDQYRNGGMEGDDFGGQVWLHLKGNRYFTFHYSM